ncbi:MAG TPA: 2-oxoacid:acceptor oxidoreductase family protein, partial [Solirubrobacterales bacterium]|nr:2-oxoacid:acceptor oxidoreductase family protein [Solirubrobacterales bacterium]
LITLAASEVANRQLGRPMPNTALLGGFAAMTGVVKLRSVVRAIAQKFSGEIADRNTLAADVAYEFVQYEIRELTRA